MQKIMFSDKYRLTKAVLEGRKTQTRRIISTNLYNRVDWKAFEEGKYDCIIDPVIPYKTDIRDYAQYKIGEEVAIAQSYNDCLSDSWITHIHEVVPDVSYDRDLSLSPGASNKMFVRADLMPHRIKITDIRVERLQDISDEDCMKEGIRRKNEIYVVENEKRVCFYTNDVRLAFRFLIDKTCGKGTWDSNPYVFVYEFELIK
ncbi:MAG: hypothetical protein KBT27_04230 [Prevotellaceae bacterium]|nr:hypothetical protein [Candidatus Faecinaster equi]